MIIRIVFIALFLVAGTLCHEPWKQDETYSFGIIYHFYMTHSWLVPMNAEIFFMEKPPLYYWTAVALCHALSGMLALHDAARLASTLYTLIALAFITKAAKLLYPENPKAAPHAALLLLSTLGILRHCHDLFTDVALLAGACITLYGIGLLALQNKEWWRAGSWSGLGIGVAFLSKGLFFPLITGLSGICLLLATPTLRTRATVKAVFMALLCASPFLFAWPYLLYDYSPALFKEWFWENNVGRFLGFSVARLGADNKPFYMAYTILWFAFPTFWLALVTCYTKRRQLLSPFLLVPGLMGGIGFLFLSASASSRALYLIPLIPCFTLLSLPALEFLPITFCRYANRFYTNARMDRNRSSVAGLAAFKTAA